MNNMFNSKYLITWTGKDICCDLDNINDVNRKQYLDRLEDVFSNGFWLTKDECEFSNVEDNHRLKIELNSRLCFTENQLTFSHEHIRRYGLMGFGFDKSFVVERKGLPIKYTVDGENDIYLSTIFNLLIHFKNNRDQDNYNNILFLLGNMKPRNDPNTGINNMVENEWRIIYTNQNKEYIKKSKKSYPISLLPFSHEELKILILPDSKTKKMFFKRKKCIEWFNKSKENLTLITYDDVVSF